MPKAPTSPPVTAWPSLADRLATLPRFFGYREVLEACDGDWDRLIDGLCGTGAEGFPRHVIDAVTDSLTPRTLEVYLLRRISRQLAQILARLPYPTG